MLGKLRGNLTAQILIAMASAVCVGLVINLSFSESVFAQETLVNGWFKAIGKMFMNALKMMIVPLVLFGLVTGVAGIGDINRMGRMGLKALLLYLGTTCVAITIGISVAVTVGVGEGIEIGSVGTDKAEKVAGIVQANQDKGGLADVFIKMIPSNPISAMANGDMLPIIVFSLLLGFGIALAREEGKPFLRVMESGNQAVLKMVAIIMKLAPYGIFCLVAKIVAESGVNAILALWDYFLVMVVVLLLHAFGTYGAMLVFIAKVNPIIFYKKFRAVQLFAFSTASSAATIPVTLRNLEKRLGVGNLISSFTVPLGATLNMDGTAIMQGVATVLVANAYGIDLSLEQYLTVIGMATLASIGTAAVRSAGTIMLVMVFGQVGLPTEGIMLILAVDPILDMIRTAVNVTGDATVSIIVSKGESSFDEETFNDPDAGLVENEDTDLHPGHKVG